MIPAIVIVAGAAGAVLRYLLSRWIGSTQVTAGGIPIAVLAVNIVGSAIGGAVLALALRGDVSSDLRLVLLTGLCGGLTTFSTFSVESVQLIAEGKWKVAIGSIAANLALGIAAAALAYLIVVAQA